MASRNICNLIWTQSCFVVAFILFPFFSYAQVQATDIQKTCANELKNKKSLAEKGDAKSQYDLYIDYLYGNCVSENVTTAMKYLKKSANLNYPRALNELGILYSNGENGLPQDNEKAASYYYASAKLDQNGAAEANIWSMKMDGNWPGDEKAAKLYNQIVIEAQNSDKVGGASKTPKNAVGAPKVKTNSGKTKQFLTDKQILEALLYEHKYGVSRLGDDIGLSQTYIDISNGYVTRSTMGISVTSYFQVSDAKCKKVSGNSLICSFVLLSSSNFGASSSKNLTHEFVFENGIWRSHTYANQLISDNSKRVIPSSTLCSYDPDRQAYVDS